MIGHWPDPVWDDIRKLPLHGQATLAFYLYFPSLFAFVPWVWLLTRRRDLLPDIKPHPLFLFCSIPWFSFIYCTFFDLGNVMAWWKFGGR